MLQKRKTMLQMTAATIVHFIVIFSLFFFFRELIFDNHTHKCNCRLA